MKILVAGLGLIGGSVCKAIHAYTDHSVYGWNRSQETLRKAFAEHAIDGMIIDQDNLNYLNNPDYQQFRLIVNCLYPNLVRKWVLDRLDQFAEGTIIMDVSGVKNDLPEELTRICAGKNIFYLSTHPMAGKERAGYDVSDEGLFQGANFIMTPVERTPKHAIAEVQNFAHQIGFRRFVITTPEMHDRMIAYTSQLAHVVSSAYVQSPVLELESGFSGGSFHDMTRVATMNPDMWTDLFMENRTSLLQELEILMANLQNYKDALDQNDRNAVYELIRTGRTCKEQNLQNRRNAPAVIDLRNKKI
ncbi:MAG: prephenate dehydrogenase [Oscillospiraceae bacterium]|nr:prephenate dehydrogenase [Oscillospiraceae bacterium]